jgi:hypothetical protein
VVLRDPAHASRVRIRRHEVEPLGHILRHALKVGVRRAGIEGAGDGGLFEDVAGVMGREGIEDALEAARAFDDAMQVGARDFLAVRQAQDGALDPLVDQVILQRRLVLEVDLGLAAR